ncbi:glutamate N-acetyltransferase [Coemansia sp. S100]|nr:glutamate N-acetyltransferase [Coemansia sp. S17]KAJ2099115.1 glutamate N-acetyltransferase [Coemansia sp. S100]KAJ2107027.1 glutamate N-acetyltransferase [Coemansia sp. S142-1]
MLSSHMRSLRTVGRRLFNTDAGQFPAAKQRFIPTSGNYPKGFYAGGSACGIKKNGKPDLAVLLSDRPAVASAVFTTNQFCAAPVQFDRQLINGAREAGAPVVRAVVTNSGCANAVTGKQGLVDAKLMSEAGDRFVSRFSGSAVGGSSSLVMSTGVIGQALPVEKISTGLDGLEVGEGHDMWMRAAVAHMTTDTFPKLLSRQYQGGFSMAGITKGAGMIHPNMATLLGTICTDANVSQEMLDRALKYAVARSFNAISVDGDMSTNDTIAVLANGASGAAIGEEGFVEFRDALTEFMAELAALVVRDGEGATKFITVEVRGARSFDDAKRVASTIATSSLVKTAFYGQDANWGRILCAVGYAGVELDTGAVDMSIWPGDGGRPLVLVEKGEPRLPLDEVRAKEILVLEDVKVVVDLGVGQEMARMYTCDLSHDYVSINADYRS